MTQRVAKALLVVTFLIPVVLSALHLGGIL